MFNVASLNVNKFYMMAVDDFCCHVFSYNLFAYLNINSVRYNYIDGVYYLSIV